MKRFILVLLAASLTLSAQAANYKIDTDGAHAFIQFKIKHLGFSWVVGQFNDFDGSFEYDKNKINHSSVMVNIKTSSLDTNHALRDEHLTGKDFLDVNEFPTATFSSTSVNMDGDQGIITGKLNLHGVEKEITLKVAMIGEGNDPWGSYRAGFDGTTTLKLEDFNIVNSLGPASASLQMQLYIEGIRQ